MNERHATLAHRVSATHAGHSPPRVRQRRDAALFPNYFGQSCYYYYYYLLNTSAFNNEKVNVDL